MTLRSSLRSVLMAGAAVLIGCIALAGTASAQDHASLLKEHKGGTLRLVTAAAEGTADPHINYTLKYWQLYQAIYDGLLAFKKGPGAEGFQVVADLAEAVPTPTDDGKTYTFKLRKGIKFSNGQDVTTKDVVASFQRIFKVSGPTAGTFYNGIVGADACIKTPDTCTLDGGVIADEKAGTITIHLAAPDPEFLYKLSVPHAAILPASTPPKDQGTDPIPGTGTYMIKSYNPNERMVLARNPSFKEWSVDAQPEAFVDEISYDFGLTEEAAITAIQNEQADWMFDPPPADRLNEIGTKNADQVHITPLTAIWYAPMNVNLAPFDNVKVRQALNYAVDRDALVGIFGGARLATPTCQVLPPGFPGHVDSCIYTADPGAEWSAPDMDKAKQLVEESGTSGQEVTIITEDTAVSKGIGTYLQSVLNDLGYKASVKPISSNIEFTYIQNTNNKVQISVTQWYQDYPAASDFLNVLLSCDSFHPGSDSSINIAGMCDKELDGRMKATLAKAVTDPEGANADWATIDQAFMEKAPWVPLFTPKHVDFTSKRVKNFVFSSQFYWLPALAWVK